MNLDIIIQTIDEGCCMELPDSDLSSLFQHRSILASGGDYCREECFGEGV